ncbi:MAG: AI-2E family transporter [Thermoanaerobaculia bacterium]|nr:AI-2E family transporter [Thermoanaerobaculia bacterium]
MNQDLFSREKFRKTFVVLLTLGISAVFFLMIRQFIMPLLLAAIFTGLLYPFYRRLLRLCRNRRAVASALTLLLVVFLILGPLSSIVGIFIAQAASVTSNLQEWFDERGRVPGLLSYLEEHVPFLDRVEPYRAQITEKTGELAGQAGRFLIKWLTDTTRGTLTFFLQLFVLLYAMFFFFMMGPDLVERVLYLMPMSRVDQERMLDRFVSVTRATIKGTFVIGLVQGGLAGIAFAVVGIEGAFFWGTLMVLMSAVPGVGVTLIWVPAVIYLLITGEIGAGIGLGIWCGAVVGSADNFLRPRLVGSDTKLPDLLILLGTLGGLFLFGAAGLIVGPIVAALFVTIWDIYGATMRDALTEQESVVEEPPEP